MYKINDIRIFLTVLQNKLSVHFLRMCLYCSFTSNPKLTIQFFIHFIDFSGSRLLVVSSALCFSSSTKDIFSENKLPIRILSKFLYFPN